MQLIKEQTYDEKVDNAEINSKSVHDSDADKSRQKLNAIESIKFLTIIAANIEQIHYYAFANKQADDKKGSILKGFYKIIQLFLDQSVPEYNCGRSVSVLKSHLHRILPKRADMDVFKNDPKLFNEIKLSGDKINRTMLSKLVMQLFSPVNYKKLIDFRFSVLAKDKSNYWCEINQQNLTPMLQLLESILGTNYLHFQNLVLKFHSMNIDYNVMNLEHSSNVSKDIYLNKLMFNIVKTPGPMIWNGKSQTTEMPTEASTNSSEETSFKAVKYTAPVHYEKQSDNKNVQFVQQSYIKLIDLMGINGMNHGDSLPQANYFNPSTKPKLECETRAINEIEQHDTVVNELEKNDEVKQNYVNLLDSVGVIIKNFTMLQSHIKGLLESHSKVRVVCVEDLTNIQLK